MARLKQQITGTHIRYEAEDLDAGIGTHAHPPGSEMEHTTTCNAGACIVYILGWKGAPSEARVLQEGESLDFDSTRWHGVVPLTVGATWTNITAGITQDDMSTVLESPHNAPQWVLDFRSKQ